MSQIKLNIETDLLDFWYPVVSGNINHVIAPFRQDLTKVEVNFSRKTPDNGRYRPATVLYECEIICKHRAKETLSNASINRDGGQAVTDAMSRLKRELARTKSNN